MLDGETFTGSYRKRAHLSVGARVVERRGVGLYGTLPGGQVCPLEGCGLVGSPPHVA